MQASRQWVVNLGAGPPKAQDPLKQWSDERGLQYLPVDILQPGGKGWDLTTSGSVWSVLLWAAANGRVVAVLSSPPHRTWCSADTAENRRTDVDPWGQSDPGTSAFRENLIATQDMFLWSLSSVARDGAIPFLKELPSTGHDLSSTTRHGVTPDRFWETESWSAFMRWSRTEVVRLHQGSLGQTWLQPTLLGTNLPLRHLQGLPPQGSPHPPKGEGNRGWSVGLKKEIVESLEGKVKGPTVEELDAQITRGLARKGEDSSDGSQCSLHTVNSLSAPSEPCGQVAIEVPPAHELSVGALTPSQREEWKAHILRGHVPYRKDCKFCVEGSGLGVQHRRVKNPQAYTLSVDLFGPMTGPEKGRDEQSVSGNPHLKFGLVGAFRLPRSDLWPLAMRYAAECHNRQVLRMAPLPAFGQSVLHKLKRPSGSWFGGLPPPMPLLT